MGGEVRAMRYRKEEETDGRRCSCSYAWEAVVSETCNSTHGRCGGGEAENYEEGGDSGRCPAVAVTGFGDGNSS